MVSLFNRFSISAQGAHLIALLTVLSVFDIVATLLGQPGEYWKGDYSAAVDANPIVVVALTISPYLSILGGILWFGFISLLMMTLSPVWRRQCYLFLCIAHLIFIWGWIVRWDLRCGIVFGCVAVGVAKLMLRQYENDLNR